VVLFVKLFVVLFNMLLMMFLMFLVMLAVSQTRLGSGMRSCLGWGGLGETRIHPNCEQQRKKNGQQCFRHVRCPFKSFKNSNDCLVTTPPKWEIDSRSRAIAVPLAATSPTVNIQDSTGIHVKPFSRLFLTVQVPLLLPVAQTEDLPHQSGSWGVW
jgi:hypothetical protein